MNQDAYGHGGILDTVGPFGESFPGQSVKSFHPRYPQTGLRAFTTWVTERGRSCSPLGKYPGLATRTSCRAGHSL